MYKRQVLYGTLHDVRHGDGHYGDIHLPDLPILRHDRHNHDDHNHHRNHCRHGDVGDHDVRGNHDDHHSVHGDVHDDDDDDDHRILRMGIIFCHQNRFLCGSFCDICLNEIVKTNQFD